MRNKLCWMVAVLLFACGWMVYGYGGAQWMTLKGDAARTGAVAETVKPPLALLWQYVVQPFRDNQSAPLVANGVVYFPVGREVFAVSASTGELLWENPYELPSDTAGPMSLADGRLLVNCRDGHLYGLDARTGALDWDIRNGGSAYAAPVVLDGKIYAATGRQGLYVASLDGNTSGEGIPTGGQVITSPAFADGTLFFTCSDGYVYSADIARKKINWQVYGASTALYSTPTVWKDFVILGNGTGNTLMAIGTRRGEVRWAVPLDGGVYASPSATPDGKVYVGTSKGKFYGIDANNRGKPLWAADLQGEVRAPATVTSSVVFVGTTQGILYALDASNGRTLWKYRLPSDSARAPAIRTPLTIAEGMGYLLADDGSLYCFSSDAFDAEPPLVTKASLIVQARDRKSYLYPLPTLTEVNAGEEEPMFIPGLPPIKLTMKLEDIASGLDESSIAVQVTNRNQPFSVEKMEYKSDTASLSVTVVGPSTGATQRAIADGDYIVTITAKDWRGNPLTERRIFKVDRKVSAPDPPAGARQATPGGFPGGFGEPGMGGGRGGRGDRGGS